MSSEDRNKNLLNQMTSSLSLNATIAAAGAAVVGGALYYYMNSSPQKNLKICDLNNQTREVAVSYLSFKNLHSNFCLNFYF